jgi:hypothetical protein
LSGDFRVGKICVYYFLGGMPCGFVLFVGEKEYYERQFGTLKSFEEVDILTTPAENGDDYETLKGEEAQELAQNERAMRISNYANVALLALKVVSRSITVSRLE